MSPDPQPVFRALADPTRRTIIELLAHEPRPVSAIAEHFEMTRPAVAKHLKILEQGGLIAVKPKGRERINHLKPEALQQAAQWIAYFDRFWDSKLDRLKKAVEEKS